MSLLAFCNSSIAESYLSLLAPTMNYTSGDVGNIPVLQGVLDAGEPGSISALSLIHISLDRLVRENYVARNGDAYHFLTDEEQDVAREIKDTRIDAAAITEEIKKIVFDGLYTARKYRKGANDFAFDLSLIHI